MPKKTWTDSQIATLLEMQAAGRFHEEIAAKIGVTRFAVTAKIRELAKTGHVAVRKRKPGVVWTEEMVAELRGLLERGLSMAMVASEMSMTRGAISGKIDRLGLFKSARPRKPIVRRSRTMTRSPVRSAPPVPPSCHPVSLMARTNSQCAFPVADFSGPHAPFFCAAAIDTIEPVQSYCAWHRAIAMPPENQPRNRL